MEITGALRLLQVAQHRKERISISGANPEPERAYTVDSSCTSLFRISKNADSVEKERDSCKLLASISFEKEMGIQSIIRKNDAFLVKQN